MTKAVLVSGSVRIVLIRTPLMMIMIILKCLMKSILPENLDGMPYSEVNNLQKSYFYN